MEILLLLLGLLVGAVAAWMASASVKAKLAAEKYWDGDELALAGRHKPVLESRPETTDNGRRNVKEDNAHGVFDKGGG